MNKELLTAMYESKKKIALLENKVEKLTASLAQLKAEVELLKDNG